MPDAGAVHLEQHDAGGISADRRPYRIAERVGGHRYVGYHRAQLGEALRRLAHARVDVGFRVGVAKTLLDHGDAQAVDVSRKCVRVAGCSNAALARVEPIGPSDHFQEQRVVGHVRGHRPAGVDGDLEQRNAGIGHEPKSRLEADDPAMARRDANRAGLVAADRHVDLARSDERRAAR